MILDNIVEEINKATDIVVLTHETPDGDAIGCSLALYGALKSMNKKVDVIIPDTANRIGLFVNSTNNNITMKYEVFLIISRTKITSLRPMARIV